jgi:hypothetical protein
MSQIRYTSTGIKHILKVRADDIPDEWEDWEPLVKIPLRKRKKHSSTSDTVWVVTTQVLRQLDTGDYNAAKRWEQYFAAQNPDNSEIIHFATYLDALALRRSNSSVKGTTFMHEYSCFCKVIDLHRDDIPGDAFFRKIPESHLLLSTLTYEIFALFFELYVTKHTNEQDIIKPVYPVSEVWSVKSLALSSGYAHDLVLSSSVPVDVLPSESKSELILPNKPLPKGSTWVNLLGPLVASWVQSRREGVTRLLSEGQTDPTFTPEIEERVRTAVLAAIDARLSHHFWLMHTSRDRELYLYACSAERQFRIRALLAINHSLSEVVKTVFKYKGWDFIAKEIAKDHLIRGMDEFQIYFELRGARCKTGRIVGGIYIDPLPLKSPITTWEF